MNDASHSATRERAPKGDVLFVLAIMAISIAGYEFATVIPDTSRDVGTAWRLVHQGEWPVLGPEIGQRWHLGPAWFYVLAPLVAVARSMTMVALGVGLLAALKFPLAYALGRRLQGRELGVLWVALLALPGWASLEQVIFAHTNLVETMTLGTLLAGVIVARGEGGAWRWAVLGAMWSLAWHAHPTTVMLAPAIAYAVWRGHRSQARRAIWPWFALMLGLMLPLAPMIVHEVSTGFSQVEATRAFVADGAFGARLSRVPVVVIGWFVHGFTLVRDHLFAPMRAWGAVVAIFSAAAIAMGTFLALVAPGAPPRRIRVAIAIWIVMAMLAIAMLRDAASFYLFYVAVPLVTGLAALGWATATRTRAPTSRDVNVGAIAALCFIAALSQLQARRAAWHDGWQWLPAATIADVGTAPVVDELPVDYFPVFALDRLAAQACEQDTLSLAGDAAVMMEYAQTLPTLLRCGDRASTHVGGDRALTGLPAALLRDAGSSDGIGTHGYAWFVAKRVARDEPAPDIALRLRPHYPPHPYRLSLDQRYVAHASLGRDHWLAVTQLNRAFVASEDPIVIAGDQPLRPAARSGNTWLYRVGAPTEVRIEVRTGDATWIDAVTFADENIRIDIDR